jgi:hypothetical protein
MGVIKVVVTYILREQEWYEEIICFILWQGQAEKEENS